MEQYKQVFEELSTAVDVYKFEREDLKKKIEELYRFVDEKQDRSDFE